MAETSKELLDEPVRPSVLEGLLLGKQLDVENEKKKKKKGETPPLGTTKVQKSQVLGKVKDFLGVMAEANEKLVASAKGSSRANYDIEVLDGNEEEYIEMDLLLGVADLHTAEAVAAAEVSMGTVQPSMSSGSSSSSDTEDESDEDSSDEECNISTRPRKKPDSHEKKTNQPVQADKPNKRPKIIELN